MWFLRRDERVSQRVSVCRALMDSNIVAPVIGEQLHFDFFKLVGFILRAIVPNNIPMFEKRSDKLEIYS